MGTTTKPGPLLSDSYDTTPGNNTSAPPVGAPEGMFPSTVNDTQRHDKAAMAEHNEWLTALDQATAIDHNASTNAVSEVNTVHPVATLTDDGFMSAADKGVLDGLAVQAAPVESVFGRNRGTGEPNIIATSGDYNADQVDFTSQTTLSATDVRAALDELESEKAPQAATQAALDDKADKAITITTNAPLSGGGDLSTSRNLSFDIGLLTGETSGQDADQYVFKRSGNHRNITLANLRAYLFTPSFESTQQALTLGGLITVAHGLGARPKLYKAYLQCVSTNLGYAVGDEVEYGSRDATQDTANNAQHDFHTLFLDDDTNIKFRVGTKQLGIGNKGTGIWDTITLSAWRLVIRAWG